jgi:hypothetical protein
VIERVDRQKAPSAGGSTEPLAPPAARPTDRPPYVALLLEAMRARSGRGTRSSDDPDGLSDIFRASLRLNALDALGRLAVVSPPVAAPPAPAATGTGQEPVTGPPLASPVGVPSHRPAAEDEEAVITGTARRAGIDPDFLRAIRRVENGGPGREFGVLSVPAPTYHDQARVAAETVRRTIARYEGTGRRAVDPASQRYTPEFIRFFSSRYAPLGAANDPTGLNRFHTRNLLRVYGGGPEGTPA